MPISIKSGPTAGSAGAVGFVAGQRQYQDQQRSIERQLRQNELQTTLGGLQSLQGFMQPFIQNSIAKQTAQWQSDMAMKEAKKKFEWMSSEDYAETNARARLFSEKAGHRAAEKYYQDASNELRKKGPSEFGTVDGSGLSLRYGGGDGTLTPQQMKGGLSQIAQRMQRIGGNSANAGLTNAERFQEGIVSLDGEKFYFDPQSGRPIPLPNPQHQKMMKLWETFSAAERVRENENSKAQSDAYKTALQTAISSGVKDPAEVSRIANAAAKAAPQRARTPEMDLLQKQLVPFINEQLGIKTPQIAGAGGAGGAAGGERIPVWPHMFAPDPPMEPVARESELGDLSPLLQQSMDGSYPTPQTFDEFNQQRALFPALQGSPEQQYQRIHGGIQERRRHDAAPETEAATTEVRQKFKDPSWDNLVSIIGNTQFSNLKHTNVVPQYDAGFGATPTVSTDRTIGPSLPHRVLSFIRQVNEEEYSIRSARGPIEGGGFSRPSGPTRLSPQKIAMREEAINWLMKNGEHVLGSLHKHGNAKGNVPLGEGTTHAGELIPFSRTPAGRQLDEMFRGF
jgi:hypothetical protein